MCFISFNQTCKFNKFKFHTLWEECFYMDFPFTL